MSNHWPSSQEEIRKAREEWEALSETQRKELRAATYKEKPINKYYVKKTKKPKKPKRVYYTTEEWADTRKKIFDRDGKICHMCGGPATHIDHLLPKSKYPELALNLDNLKPACKDCNFTKLDIVREEYLKIFNKEFR